MLFQKNLAWCVALLAAAASFAADAPPALNPDPVSPASSAAPRLRTPADDTAPSAESAPGNPAPPSLLPDEIPTAPKRPALQKPPAPAGPRAAVKPVVTAAEFDLRIRYRKARNVAELNEKVRAAWAETRDLPTDLQKRRALKNYYNILFAQMMAVDRGIAPLVEKQRLVENARLTQTHIAPTVELE